MKFSYQVATPEVLYNPGMTCLQGDFRENVKLLAELGYDSVELMTTEPRSLDWAYLKDTLEEFGMTAALVCTGEMGALGRNVSDPNPLRRTQGLRRIFEAVDLAAYLGVDINAGRIKGDFAPGISREAMMENAVDGFRRLCDYAAERNVRVALETAAYVFMSFINTCAEGETLIHAVDRPNFGLMMDIFHMYVEERDLLRSITEYGRYNLHVHLADNNRMYPGACGMDFRRIITAFHDSGFDGAFTVEVRQLPSPEEAARGAARHLQPLFEEIYGRKSR